MGSVGSACAVALGLGLVACGQDAADAGGGAGALAAAGAGGTRAEGFAGRGQSGSGGGAGASPGSGGTAGRARGGDGGGGTPVVASAGRAGSTAGSGGAAAGSGGATAQLRSGTGSSGMSDGKLTATIQMKDVPPGDEEHHCVVVELPNAQPVWVSSLRATLTAGSHHLIVDRNPQAQLITTSQSCSPTMAGDATRLLIAQQRDTRLDLPSGVAYRLDAHQHVFLQLHFINVTETPATIAGTVELTLADAASTPKEAKSMFTGATNIMLQPKQPGSAKFFSKLAAQGGPLQVFALTSHTHQLGTRATIERVASADAPETTALHESLDWAEPPLTQLSTPLRFDGSDGLRLTCRYMNTTDRTVSFGTSASDEMCFMWLYYYQ